MRGRPEGAVADLARERRPVSLPEINIAKCVHSLSHLGTCSKCIRSCPAGALAMAGALPSINASLCNGCGLCQAACPQNVFQIKETVPVLGSTALLVCEKNANIRADLRMRCVHSQGLEQLAGLYQRGVREIAVASGDCAACVNGNSVPLARHMAIFNELALSRDLPVLTIIDADPASCARWPMENRTGDEIDESRRGFLRMLAKPAIKADGESDKTQSRALPLMQAPRPGDKDRALFAAVPDIDPAKCNGCDACVNICAQQVLTLVKDDDGPRCYKIMAEHCTGCAVCMDICNTGAMSLAHMAAKRNDGISLAVFRCTICGAPYHVPVQAPDNNGRCTICAQTDHHKKLFQILE